MRIEIGVPYFFKVRILEVVRLVRLGGGLGGVGAGVREGWGGGLGEGLGEGWGHELREG